MAFKSVLRSSGLKAFVGLLLIFCFLQLIGNNKEIKSTFSATTNYYSNMEKDYRKRFNLMVDEPEETGEECTLGTYTSSSRPIAFF